MICKEVVERFDHEWQAKRGGHRDPDWQVSVARFYGMGMSIDAMLEVLDAVMFIRSARRGSQVISNWKAFCQLSWRRFPPPPPPRYGPAS